MLNSNYMPTHASAIHLLLSAKFNFILGIQSLCPIFILFLTMASKKMLQITIIHIKCRYVSSQHSNNKQQYFLNLPITTFQYRTSVERSMKATLSIFIFFCKNYSGK